MKEWTEASTQTSVKWYLDEDPLSMILPTDHQSTILSSISTIHQFILTASTTKAQTGVYPQPGTCGSITKWLYSRQPNKASIKTITTRLTNDIQASEHPNSFSYLLEKIIFLNNNVANYGSLDLIYVGPILLRQFMECFCQLYKTKSIAVKKERENLRYMYIHSTYIVW